MLPTRRAGGSVPWYGVAMDEKDTVTIPISADERARLRALAAAREESEETLASEAMRTYLSVQERHAEEITRSLEASERPDARFVPHEEVAAWVGSLDTDQPLPIPTARTRAEQ